VVLRQLQLAVAVRGPHHRDVAPDAVESDGAVHPKAFDLPLAFQLHAELGEERDSGIHVSDNAEPGRDHEQPAAGEPRGRCGDEHHVPELGDGGAVHRHFLHADHPGPGLLAAAALNHGLVAQGVSHADAARIAALPPVSVMFATLLGYNPVQTLLGHALTKLPASHAAYLTRRSFFPALISPAFSNGLHIAFDFAIAACLIAAIASLLRGRRYVHEEHGLVRTGRRRPPPTTSRRWPRSTGRGRAPRRRPARLTSGGSGHTAGRQRPVRESQPQADPRTGRFSRDHGLQGTTVNGRIISLSSCSRTWQCQT
jgi:hypothetical protein